MASTKYRKPKSRQVSSFNHTTKLIANVAINEEKLLALSPQPVPDDPWEQAAAFFSIYPPSAIIRLRNGDLDKSGKVVPKGSVACGLVENIIAVCRDGSLSDWVEGNGGYFNINPFREYLAGHTGEVTDRDVKDHTFVLLEHDDLSVQDQLKLLAVLPLPIASIVDTGGKSLHALLQVNGASRADYDHHVMGLYKTLKPLGFDPSNKNPSRYSRFPGAPRLHPDKSIRLQRLLYLNPNPNNQSILSHE